MNPTKAIELYQSEINNCNSILSETGKKDLYPILRERKVLLEKGIQGIKMMRCGKCKHYKLNKLCGITGNRNSKDMLCDIDDFMEREP